MKRNRIFKGCLFGCLGFCALCIILGISGVLWVTHKGEFDPATSILEPETDLFFRANLTPDDEDLITFFTDLTNRINEANNQEMPEFLRNFQQQSTERDIRMMLPLEVETALETDDETYGVAIGFSLYNNLAKLGFALAKWVARDEGDLHEHNGRKYIGSVENREPVFFSLERNTLFIADNKRAMNAMLDSLDGGPVDHTLDARLRGVDVNAPVYGFAAGYPAFRLLMRSFLEWDLRPEEAAALENEIRHLGFFVRVNTDETMDLLFFLETLNRDERVHAALERSLDSMLAGSELATETSLTETATGYEGVIRFSGFTEAATREY